MSWRGVVYNLAFATVVLLMLGRLIGLPVYIGIVPSSSMEPTLKRGDLLVVSNTGRDVGVGDIVVWCMSPLHCIVHRVVSIEDGMVTTKGDANPTPDPPVGLDVIRGRVVCVVPRVIWVPAVSIAGILYLYWKRRFPADSIAALYLLVTVLVLTSAPPIYTSITPYEVHYTQLQSITLTSDGSINVTYTGLGVDAVAGCRITYLSTPWQCSAVVDGMSVIVKPQAGFYVYVVDNGVNTFTLELNLTLQHGGFLEGIYNIVLPVEKPVIEEDNGSLVIYNPNIYPIKLNLTIALSTGEGGLWNITSKTMLVPASAFYRIDTTQAEYVNVVIDYQIFGLSGHFSKVYHNG